MPIILKKIWIALTCMLEFFDHDYFGEAENPSVYELINKLPNGKGTVGVKYSNLGNRKGDALHYPCGYENKKDNEPIPTNIIMNSPEYFKRLR